MIHSGLGGVTITSEPGAPVADESDDFPDLHPQPKGWEIQIVRQGVGEMQKGQIMMNGGIPETSEIGVGLKTAGVESPKTGKMKTRADAGSGWPSSLKSTL